jgi:hypothetical protein
MGANKEQRSTRESKGPIVSIEKLEKVRVRTDIDMNNGAGQTRAE